MARNGANAHIFTRPLCHSHSLKPIFHCDAKLLAPANFALPNAKDSTFALPNAKNTNMLVSLALGDANFLRWPCIFLFFVYIIFAHFQWNIGCVGSQTQKSCVGHVHFMLFVSVSFALGGHRKPSFQWNMGFRHLQRLEQPSRLPLLISNQYCRCTWLILCCRDVFRCRN